jgi:hypothetical protein
MVLNTDGAHGGNTTIPVRGSNSITMEGVIILFKFT